MEPFGYNLGEHSILSAIFGSGIVVQGVLILLIFLSVMSWAIAIAKILQYRRASSESKAFTNVFLQTRNLAQLDEAARRYAASPLSQVFAAAYIELSRQIQSEHKGINYNSEMEITAVERSLNRASVEEISKLDKGLTFLATVASAAPFIGLFGTVWGIMNAFHGLSAAKSSTIQAVAPGISEALVATAIGLAAAIPAAIAYNYFAVIVRRFRQNLDRFSDELLGLIKMYLVSRG